MAASMFDPTGDDPYGTAAKARAVQQALQNGMNPPPQAAAAQAPAAAAAGAPATGGLGQWGNQLEGFDQGKLANGHRSPKYDFARIASHYDPRQGITDPMLKELNALGEGTFSGSGDHLHVDNGAAGFGGLTDFDTVRAFKQGADGSGGWQWLDDKTGGSPGAAPAVQGALGGAFGQGAAGNAPYASSQWLNSLLKSLGVSIGGF